MANVPEEAQGIITVKTFNYAEHTGYTSGELPTSTYSVGDAIDQLVHLTAAGYQISDVVVENDDEARLELTLLTEDKKQTRIFTGSQKDMAEMVGTFMGRILRV